MQVNYIIQRVSNSQTEIYTVCTVFFVQLPVALTLKKGENKKSNISLSVISYILISKCIKNFDIIPGIQICSSNKKRSNIFIHIFFFANLNSKLSFIPFKLSKGQIYEMAKQRTFDTGLIKKIAV